MHHQLTLYCFLGYSCVLSVLRSEQQCAEKKSLMQIAATQLCRIRGTCVTHTVHSSTCGLGQWEYIPMGGLKISSAPQRETAHFCGTADSMLTWQLRYNSTPSIKKNWHPQQRTACSHQLQLFAYMSVLLPCPLDDREVTLFFSRLSTSGGPAVVYHRSARRVA